MVAMLDGVKGSRRNQDRKALQGPCVNSIGANECGQDGCAGTGEDRRENRLIGRQFDRNIQPAIGDAECPQKS